MESCTSVSEHVEVSNLDVLVVEEVAELQRPPKHQRRQVPYDLNPCETDAREVAFNRPCTRGGLNESSGQAT